jgi:hypothetical protein
LRAKNLDHADDGAQQTQQRRCRCNGGQRAEVALQPVCPAGRAFHDGAQFVFAAAGVVVECPQATLASTSPSAEFCSSLLTTSGAGTALRATANTSSSSLGGAMRWLFSG